MAALYHFADLPDCADWRRRLLDYGNANGVKGTMVLAAEGINGTIAGTRGAIDGFLALVKADSR